MYEPEPTTGCWLYTGGLNSSGYGKHRKFYEAYVGPIPKGGVVMHTCHVRCCVNPDHLTLGSQSQNLRMARDEQGTLYLQKLTRPQVDEIRRKYAEGDVSQSALGREYGVVQQTISWIVRGVTWLD